MQDNVELVIVEPENKSEKTSFLLSNGEKKENAKENTKENVKENVKESVRDEHKDDEKQPQWHLLSLEEICNILDISRNIFNVDVPRQSVGLQMVDATERFQKNGPNELTPTKEKSAIIQYLSKYLDPFMVALTVAGILSLIIFVIDTSVMLNLYLTIILFVVVIFSATFAYIQEGRSRAVMSQFNKLMPSNCNVIREGKQIVVKARELVIGDIVYVHSGDRVPADMRLFNINELKVETSALTGESLPITCTLDSEESRMIEASNVIWSSCNVMDGDGYGIVIQCGDHSMIGRIHQLTDCTETSESTLQREIRRFVYILAGFALLEAIIVFIVAMARHKPVLESIVLCFIVVMVANTPEGLPSTVISLLVIIGKRLADNNVNVKRLQNVETLGSVTVIASDKTGTITQNKMTVSQVWFDNNLFDAEILKNELPANSITSSIADQVKMPPMQRNFSSFNVLANIRTENYSRDIQDVKEDKEISFNQLEPNIQAFIPHLESEAYIVPISTLSNLELIATLCNRSRFEDEKVLTDDEASYLYAISSKTASSSKSKSTSLNRIKFGEMIIENRKRSVTGDASDKALFQFVSGRQSIELIRYQYNVLFELPFSSKNKYALTLIQARVYDNKKNNNNPLYLLMKGAPEIVLTRCSKYQHLSLSKEIDKEFNNYFDQTYQTMANGGERVLGFAMIMLDKKNFNILNQPNVNICDINFQLSDLPTKGYEFVGLISLIDPPKAKVLGAVAECRSAGVKVVMVTGDHPLTAKAIAGQVGIITEPTLEDIERETKESKFDIDDNLVNAIVINGKDIDSFNEGDWKRILNKKEIVFARTTPEHKLKIVEHLQAMGHIVAVTGDGVNDAPALKRADVGVAMGIGGSDVARAAAAVVLMDDDFSSIVLGIKEGRVLFDNLLKTTAYTLTHLWPELMPVVLNICFDLPLAMNSLPILLIDCGTELAPAISLAYEKPEDNVMKRPPRNMQKDRLSSWRLLSYSYPQGGSLETLMGFLGYLLVYKYNGVPVSYLPFSAQYWVSGAPDLYIKETGRIFTADEQVVIYQQSTTLYWFLIVVSQICHIFLSRTRTQSIFQHGILGNMTTNYGVLIEIALIIIFIFVPDVANVLEFNYHFPKKLWALFVLSWGLLIIWNEGGKYMYRNNITKYSKKIGY